MLREAAWLTPDRATAWVRVLAAVSALAVIAAIALSPHGLTPQAKPLGTDFISFYAASALARTNPVAAYDPHLHAQAEISALPGLDYGYTTFLYPPTFLLVCLPLALLPYLPALIAWLGAGLAALTASVRPLLAPRLGVLPLLAYPGVLVNAGHGQNGCLTGAMFAGYMALGARAPALAGALLGALVVKPQLALAVPLTLLAARRWRALAAATTAAAALCLLSLLVFGPRVWLAFLHGGSAGRIMLEQGLNDYAKMQSAFAAVRLAGGGIALAWTLQAAVAAGAAVWAIALVRRQPGPAAEGAAMATAALLMSPWSFDYDLVLLAGPLAWLTVAGLDHGFLPWEKAVLASAYALPLFSRSLASASCVAAAPPVLLALLWSIQRRTAA